MKEYYVHYKNNELYEILDTELMIQIDDVWKPAVLYKHRDGSMQFVRSQDEFFKKFSRL